MPVLVFRKTGDAADERQRDFIARVGEYQRGRFWKEFRDNSDLAVGVLDALREVTEEAAPLRWEPVDTEPVVRWLADRPRMADRDAGYIPVLETHLAAVTGRLVLPVSALEPLASRLGRAGRDAGLFTESASVDLGADTSSAWAKSCADTTRRAWDQVSRGGPAGVAVDRDGSVIAFKPLARDTLGALVNQPYQRRDPDTPLRRVQHRHRACADEPVHRQKDQAPCPTGLALRPHQSTDVLVRHHRSDRGGADHDQRR